MSSTLCFELSGYSFFVSSRRHQGVGCLAAEVLYLENISEFQVPQDLDAVMQEKTQLVSVLMPPRDRP